MDVNSCYLGTLGLRELALYSHLIPAIATLVLGIFALIKASDRLKAAIFFTFTLTFAAWLVADLVNWTTDNYALVAATWAPLDFINIAFFLVLFYFVYFDLFKKLPSRVLAGAIGIAALIPFFITISGNSVYEFYQPWCEMLGNDFLAQYKLGLEAFVLLAILLMGIFSIWREHHNHREQIRVALVTGTIVLFLGIFSGAEYLSTSTAVYEIMLYTLFVLPVFVLFLTIAITSYGTFKLGDTAVRVLFYIFLILAATQFFFVGDLTEFLLAGMSFGVVLTLGIMLYMTSEREIRLRHVVESQAKELEVMNKQQENLLQFISHEVKGYLAKSAGAYAGILQGDYGKVTVKLKEMADGGLTDMRKGVDMVSDILDAANLRKGTVKYTTTTFNFKDSIDEVMHDVRPVAEKKGVVLELSAPAGEYNITGDEAKMRRHVIRNLIENALHYTPTGSIRVSLSRNNNKLHFSVKDTGIGITKEDMQNLFTEGGHGKESIKVNVDSTGYGLFIAKQVTEKHGGTIRVESAGKGKGSEFIVELPIT